MKRLKFKGSVIRINLNPEFCPDEAIEISLLSRGWLIGSPFYIIGYNLVVKLLDELGEPRQTNYETKDIKYYNNPAIKNEKIDFFKIGKVRKFKTDYVITSLLGYEIVIAANLIEVDSK